MTNAPNIALVVEGYGDVAAAPVLVRRVLEDRGIWPNILPPHRVPKTKMQSELNRTVRLQLSRVGNVGGVLVLVDADSDDPAGLAQVLHGTLDPDLADRCCVVVATKEYEAWFLGGIRSLRGHKSMRTDADFDGDPEAPRDAKGRLAAQMNESYQETIHQVAFSAIVDLRSVSEACPSFARLSECLAQLSQIGQEPDS